MHDPTRRRCLSWFSSCVELKLSSNKVTPTDGSLAVAQRRCSQLKWPMVPRAQPVPFVPLQPQIEVAEVVQKLCKARAEVAERWLACQPTNSRRSHATVLEVLRDSGSLRRRFRTQASKAAVGRRRGSVAEPRDGRSRTNPASYSALGGSFGNKEEKE